MVRPTSASHIRFSASESATKTIIWLGTNSCISAEVVSEIFYARRHKELEAESKVPRWCCP